MSRTLLKAAVPLLAGSLLGGPTPARPTPQEPGPLVETQRVTAFDVLVELTRPNRPGRTVAAPADLAPADFTIRWDGAPLPVVAVAPGGADEEPWRLVVYIDRVLSSNHTIRWAAMELAERARRLTELGEVEIVVAEPEPRRALAPTRDRELLDQSLSGVFLAPAGATDLVSLREEYLIAHPSGSAGAAPEAARRAAGEERRLLRRQTDRLLAWLVESAPPTSRRAVLLVADGWDLRPEEFYASPSAVPAAAGGDGNLETATVSLAETLAAYGWIVAPLAPPPPPVGVGRFGAFVLPDVTFPWLFAVKLRSLEVWLDGNRKPKRADALTELGHSLRAAGRLDRAVETYRQAVYHYYDHPKTAKRQAATLVALGETLELQQKTREARAAFRTATAFHPALRSRFPFAAAGLLTALEPLEKLAEITAGNVATDVLALDRLLISLAQRVRLTAQLSGVPDGALHRLDVDLLRAGLARRSPGLARWGTPPAVSRLRLRRLIDGDLPAGSLELTGSLTRRSRSRDGRRAVELQLTPATAAAAGGAGAAERVLVSWASAGPDTGIHYGLRTATIALGPAGTASLEIAIEPPAGSAWLAFLVEDPAGGAWGGTVLGTDAE